MIGIPEQQFVSVAERYPGSELRPMDDGARIAVIDNVVLRPGLWNKPSTKIGFVVPVGYPMARPDCFWADGDLRLANGGMPKNAQFNAQYFFADWLWFSYHPVQWDTSRDTLITYVRLIKQRLADAQ